MPQPPAEQKTLAEKVYVRGLTFSADGRWLAWSGTGRNGADYDIYVRDMRSGETRRVLEKGGLWSALDFSDDGKKLLVGKYVSINEAYPGEIDLATAPEEKQHIENALAEVEGREPMKIAGAGEKAPAAGSAPNQARTDLIGFNNALARYVMIVKPLNLPLQVKPPEDAPQPATKKAGKGARP